MYACKGVLTCAGAMSVASSDSDYDNSVHEDEKEENGLEEEEKLLEEDRVTEGTIEELEETAEEEDGLEEDSLVDANIDETLQLATDINMERDLTIVAVPPKIVPSEENHLEISSSPAFHILDTVSIQCVAIKIVSWQKLNYFKYCLTILHEIIINY